MSESTPPSRKPLLRRRWFLSVVLLALAALTLAFFVLQESVRRAPIPLGTPSGALSYISHERGAWEIVTLLPDGTRQFITAASEAEAHDYFPSYAMDGGQMNFVTTRTGALGPAQAGPDGDNLRTLDTVSAVLSVAREGRLDWDPAWSPAGERLAWASLRDLNLELYVIDTAADFSPSNANRLTRDGGRDWFPAWSPNGTRLAFISDREGSEDVYLIDADGRNLTRLTETPSDEVHPFWTLDGAQLAYISQERQQLTDGALDIWLIDLTSGEARPLGEGAKLAGDPVWSPDGAQMVYMSNERGNWDIYSRDLADGQIERLTDSEADEMFPVWRP